MKSPDDTGMEFEKRGLRIERLDLAILVFALIGGAAFRFHDLENVPPGMWADEVTHSEFAKEATEGRTVSLLWHWLPITCRLAEPHHQDNEPFFNYTAGVLQRIFPADPPLPLRRTAALFSLLALVPFFFIARGVAGRLPGSLATVLLAVSRWPVLASHVGFRANLLPFFLLAAFAAAWKASRNRSTLWAVTAGILAGLSFYIYLPGKGVLVGVGVFLLLSRLAKIEIGWSRRQWVGALAAYAIVLVPAVIAMAASPGQQVSRSREVALSADTAGLGEMVGNLWRVPAAFVWRGDTLPRHNLPGAAGLQIWLVPFFVIGLFESVRTWRRPVSLALLTWWVVMMIPSVVTGSAPHFLRMVGSRPPAFLFMAIGLGKAGSFLRERGWIRSRAALGALAAVLALAVAAETYHQVFAIWPKGDAIYLTMNAFMPGMADFVRKEQDRYTIGLSPQLWTSPGFQYYYGREPDEVHVGKGFVPGETWDRTKPLILLVLYKEESAEIPAEYPEGRAVKYFRTPGGSCFGIAWEVPWERMRTRQGGDRSALPVSRNPL